jgi:hypothetical protein
MAMALKHRAEGDAVPKMRATCMPRPPGVDMGLMQVMTRPVALRGDPDRRGGRAEQIFENVARGPARTHVVAGQDETKQDESGAERNSETRAGKRLFGA